MKLASGQIIPVRGQIEPEFAIANYLFRETFLVRSTKHEQQYFEQPILQKYFHRSIPQRKPDEATRPNIAAERNYEGS